MAYMKCDAGVVAICSGATPRQFAAKVVVVVAFSPKEVKHG